MIQNCRKSIIVNNYSNLLFQLRMNLMTVQIQLPFSGFIHPSVIFPEDLI